MLNFSREAVWVEGMIGWEIIPARVRYSDGSGAVAAAADAKASWDVVVGGAACEERSQAMTKERVNASCINPDGENRMIWTRT